MGGPGRGGGVTASLKVAPTAKLPPPLFRAVRHSVFFDHHLFFLSCRPMSCKIIPHKVTPIASYSISGNEYHVVYKIQTHLTSDYPYQVLSSKLPIFPFYLQMS